MRMDQCLLLSNFFFERFPNKKKKFCSVLPYCQTFKHEIFVEICWSFGGQWQCLLFSYLIMCKHKRDKVVVTILVQVNHLYPAKCWQYNNTVSRQPTARKYVFIHFSDFNLILEMLNVEQDLELNKIYFNF